MLVSVLFHLFFLERGQYQMNIPTTVNAEMVNRIAIRSSFSPLRQRKPIRDFAAMITNEVNRFLHR
jgi:hypothetical protein